MQQKNLNLIMATMFDGGIGYDDKIPWHIPEELKKFKELTKRVEDECKMNAVIMGRNTWESLPRRPLLGRINIVISTDNTYKTPYKNVIVLHDLFSVIMYCNFNDIIENIYIIGGAQIYNQMLSNEFFKIRINKIYLSVVFHDVNHIANKKIDMNQLMISYKWKKDINYKKQSDDRLFASYILEPKL